MDTLFLQGWNFLLGVVGTVFNIVFFWLPNDPLTEYLNDASVQAASAQGVSWLNWFVDVQMFAGVLSAFVTVLLLFAVFKVVSYIVKFIMSALDAVPFIG